MLKYLMRVALARLYSEEHIIMMITDTRQASNMSAVLEWFMQCVGQF